MRERERVREGVRDRWKYKTRQTQHNGNAQQNKNVYCIEEKDKHFVSFFFVPTKQDASDIVGWNWSQSVPLFLSFVPSHAPLCSLSPSSLASPASLYRCRMLCAVCVCVSPYELFGCYTLHKRNINHAILRIMLSRPSFKWGINQRKIVTFLWAPGIDRRWIVVVLRFDSMHRNSWLIEVVITLRCVAFAGYLVSFDRKIPKYFAEERDVE